MSIPGSQHDIVPGWKIDKRWWNFLNDLSTSAITSAQVSALISDAIAGIEQPDIQINGSATILVTGNATDGFSLTLPEIEDSGVGAGLYKFTRDAFGRIEGTEAADTDDLAEGATNLYYTDTRADARVTAGIAAHVAASDPHTQYLQSGEAQANIQFKDEGSNIGTAGAVTAVNFTGAGVTASHSSGTVTVDIPGGGGGSGDVVGPASATNEHIAVYDGTTGKLIKGGGYTVAGLLAAMGGGTYIDPRARLIDPLYDFLGKPPTVTTAEAGASYPWVVSRLDGTAAITSINGGSTAPGVWQLTTGNASTNAIGFSLGSVPNIVIGAGEVRLPFRFRVPTLSNATDRFACSIGLADSFGGTTNHGVRVTYTDNNNSGKLTLVTANSGTSTSQVGSTTVAANTLYSCELVINAAGTEARLYVNGTLEATSTTNLPTGAMLVGAVVFKIAGTAARGIDIDYLGPPQIQFTASR